MSPFSKHTECQGFESVDSHSLYDRPTAFRVGLQTKLGATRMLCATSLVATACLASSSMDELQTIGREIAGVWGEGTPARNLRVRCRFDLKIEHNDEALGDRDFPNPLIEEGKGPRRKSRARPQTAWSEDVARSGQKYRNDYEFFPPDTGETPRGWKIQNFYNGTNSWHYDGIKGWALQYQGAAITTRPRLGYYLDMIGFPSDPIGKERTTAGGSGEPYQLDQLISSGKYGIDGEEVIDGLNCVILARPGFDRLWLAKDRGWAIARREWRWSAGGPIKRRFVNRDFRTITPGAWVPFEASMEIYGHPTTRPGQRVGVLKAAVQEVEADVPDDWFEPHFPIGTMVDDRATGSRYPFGKEIESLDGAVVRASRYGPMFHPEPWWQRPVSWGIVGAAMLCVTAAARSWNARKGGQDR